VTHRRVNTRRPRRGYTLLEVVLVLALLVVLAAMAYPSLDAMYGGYRLTAAVDMVRAGWAAARAHALDEGQAYRFAIIPGSGRFRIAPDSSDYWGDGGAPEPTDPANPPLIQEDSLPKRVLFADVEFGQGGQGSGDAGGWMPVATFLPDGTAREDVRITFQAHGGRPLALKLRGMTGIVTQELVTPEGHRP
jgi:prepilin-type N-terminal cleavage/methylation domain-containing protein